MTSTVRTARPSAQAPTAKSERFAKAGWTFATTTSSIASSAEMDALSEKVGFPLPEMVFSANRTTLSHEGGLSISFAAEGALMACPPTTKIKLAVADEKAWKSQRKGMSPALAQWRSQSSAGARGGVVAAAAAAAATTAAAAAAAGAEAEATARRSPLDFDWTCEFGAGSST